MSCVRVIATAWLVIVMATGRAQTSAEAGVPEPPVPTAGDKAATDFFSGPILTFEVQLSAKSLQSLREDARKSVPATVLVGGERFESVGVHVKGSAGSRRNIDDGAALTLSFDKFKPGQLFRGLKKIHLNNSAQDPSRMNEMLGTELYRRLGIPVSRATHGFVKINGSDNGLYVVKEGFDKVWVRRNFSDPEGNLYDGGFLQDVDNDLKRDSGSGPENWQDLRQLSEAAELRDPARRGEALGRLLDLEQFTSFCALQNLLCDWDGYVYNRNNFRIYHEPRTGRFTFIPHGMDQLLGETTFRLDRGMNGLVARQVWELPGQRARMTARMESLLTNVFTIQVITEVYSNALARLEPAWAQRRDNERRFLLPSIEESRQRAFARIRNVRQQILSRPKALRFDTNGVALVTGWASAGESQRARADIEMAADGTKSYILEALSEGGTVSWRRRIRLPKGSYSLEARIKSEGVQARTDGRGRGIGIRIGLRTRTNSVENSSAWTVISENLESDGEQEQDLAIEMRADAGKLWIDQGSLRLRKR